MFASQTRTELLPSNVYRRVLAPAAKSVGFTVEVDGKSRSAVSFHTFRHSCASLLFEAGRNVKQVQEWLGHADPSFTLRTYVHLMDADVGSAEFFDSAVGAPTAPAHIEARIPALPQPSAKETMVVAIGTNQSRRHI